MSLLQFFVLFCEWQPFMDFLICNVCGIFDGYFFFNLHITSTKQSISKKLSSFSKKLLHFQFPNFHLHFKTENNSTKAWKSIAKISLHKDCTYSWIVYFIHFYGSILSFRLLLECIPSNIIYTEWTFTRFHILQMQEATERKSFCIKFGTIIFNTSSPSRYWREHIRKIYYNTCSYTKIT